jgi:hypothetical protein
MQYNRANAARAVCPDWRHRPADRENEKNLRRLTVTVTAQTAHHLREKAGSDGRRALGRVIDDMTRANQATKNNRGGKHHGMV